MFQNSKDIHILSVPRNPRQYLVLIRAGSKPRPSFFKEALPNDRGYDLGLNYYAPPHPDDVLRATADVVFTGGLAKMHGAKRFFEATGLHEIYEGVFFVDDDVEILFNPDAFFAFCREYSLALAQPALTSDCIDAIGLTRQHPGLKLRTTNWVEIMAPFFVRDFLKEMLHSFNLSISGWGLDLYWGHHLDQRWTAGIWPEGSLLALMVKLAYMMLLVVFVKGTATASALFWLRINRLLVTKASCGGELSAL